MKFEMKVTKKESTNRMRTQWLNLLHSDNASEELCLLHITHTDPDGLTCAVIVNTVFSELDPTVYTQVPKNRRYFSQFTEPSDLLEAIKDLATPVSNDASLGGEMTAPVMPDIILITDLNFNTVHMEAMDALHIPYMVLDHHISDISEEQLYCHPNILCEYKIPDTEDFRRMDKDGMDLEEQTAIADIRSGASLVADALDASVMQEALSDRIYFLSRAIAARDTFSHKIVPSRLQDGVDVGQPRTRYEVGNRLTMLFDILGRFAFMRYLTDYLRDGTHQSSHIWHLTGYCQNTNWSFVEDLINSSLENHEKKVSSMVDSAIIKEAYLPTMQENGNEKWIKYLVGSMIGDGAYASDAGNRLCDEKDVDVAIIWTKVDEYSLRSTREDINVQAIAKCYGGGGHKHASGFSRKETDDFVWLFDYSEDLEKESKEPKRDPNLIRWNVDLRDPETNEIFSVDYSVAVTEGYEFSDSNEICSSDDADLIADITGPNSMFLYLIKENPSEEEIRQFYRACGIGKVQQDDLLRKLKCGPKRCPVAGVGISRSDGEWLVRTRFKAIMNLTGRTLVDLPIIPKEDGGLKVSDLPNWGLNRYLAERSDHESETEKEISEDVRGEESKTS